VDGNRFVDGNGKTVQLRGVNVSDLESVAVMGWNTSNPWDNGKPQWPALASWKINAVRFPLNEASWLDYTCVDSNNKQVNPDPGNNYKQTVEETVAEATAAGFYVILDLHWSAPSNICPQWQNAMADADHSPAFWTAIANTFKDNPAVIFEMFNEPFLPETESGWSTWLNGGPYNLVGNPGSSSATWQVAGEQQLIQAVRTTGATNVILVGGLAYSNDLTGWPTHTPQDPQGQLGAAWHTYSNNPYVDVVSAGSSTVNMVSAVSANVPVAITEIGDVDGPGTTPGFAEAMLPFADKAGYSYFGWTWNVWGQSANDLILDASGTPTQGFGTYFKQHLICRASSTNCQ
jgi:aryl-phospho-beta-D-glucosidase BglC (GH1 family)